MESQRIGRDGVTEHTQHTAGIRVPSGLAENSVYCVPCQPLSVPEFTEFLSLALDK